MAKCKTCKQADVAKAGDECKKYCITELLYCNLCEVCRTTKLLNYYYPFRMLFPFLPYMQLCGVHVADP